MQYNVTLVGGKTFEVDENTYNKLTGRVKSGRVNGFYTVESGVSKGTSFHFPHIASIEIAYSDDELLEMERETASKKLGNVPKSFTNDKDVCPVNHEGIGSDKAPNVNVRFLITDRGTKQYFPVCDLCGWRGKLVKPAALENTYGIKVSEVLPYETGNDEDK